MEQVNKRFSERRVFQYVTECMGGNIEGIRIGNMYILEHGSGRRFYFGTLEDEGDTSFTSSRFSS